MKQGVSVWLDVPLDALARRIAAVGTASRPLLDEESGDAYTKVAFMHMIFSKEREKESIQASTFIAKCKMIHDWWAPSDHYPSSF